MFDRYSESAKRVIFFGRYEASRYRSPEIRPEHLLLGLFRGDRRLARKVLGSGGPIKRFLSSSSSIESIRGNIRVVGRNISTSADIPLSEESKQVLEYASEEADRLTDRHIRSKHLLLGLLRENQGLAAQLLNGEGGTLERARDRVS
jgi:ATP-dependent Clp protease ATP-binding subunit ClpC